MDEPVKILKPTIDFRFLILDSFVSSFIFMSVILIFLYMFIFSQNQSFESFISFFPKKYVFSFILLVFFLFVFSVLISFFYSFFSLKHTEYRFFSDRVEYFFGFFSVSKKVLPYSRVVNLSLRKGFFERFFDLGSIFLETPGSSTKGYELVLKSIRTPENVYDELRKLILKDNFNNS